MPKTHGGGTERNRAPTRREYVKYGGAIVGGGLLAGCTGNEYDFATEAIGARSAWFED